MIFNLQENDPEILKLQSRLRSNTCNSCITWQVSFPQATKRKGFQLWPLRIYSLHWCLLQGFKELLWMMETSVCWVRVWSCCRNGPCKTGPGAPCFWAMPCRVWRGERCQWVTHCRCPRAEVEQCKSEMPVPRAGDWGGKLESKTVQEERGQEEILWWLCTKASWVIQSRACYYMRLEVLILEEKMLIWEMKELYRARLNIT